MNLPIITSRLSASSCCGELKTVSYIQKRYHARIYPWRFNRLNRQSHQDNTRTDYTDPTNINEFVNYKRKKKDWQIVIPKDKDNRFNAYKQNYTYNSDPKEALKQSTMRLNSLKDSLITRGNPREVDPYQPSDNVESRTLELARTSSSQTASECDNERLLNLELSKDLRFKFEFISKCIEEFKHHLPSNYLNEMMTVKDVVDYFSTPVRGLNPYAAMVRGDDKLPINLSLISNPMRFDKETDTYFEGISAFPGLISKVPGIRGGKKHPILNQDEFQWPDI